MTNVNHGKVCLPSAVRPHEGKEREKRATWLCWTAEVYGMKLCLHDRCYRVAICLGTVLVVFVGVVANVLVAAFVTEY